MKENLSLIFCAVLLIGFIYLFLRVDNLKIPEPQNITTTLTQTRDVCGSDCKKEIATAVSQAISSLPTPIPASTPATVKTQLKTAYIPIAGPITTTSTNWVDATGTDFYLDLGADYSPDATVSWEAVLSLSNSSDQVYARLYDVTHAIEVGGSEVTLVNTTVSTSVASGTMSFWRGFNSYRVQLKSRNSTLVSVVSGRIKIVY